MSRPVVAFASVMLLAAFGAEARPLDADACGKLKGEMAALDDKGVKALIEKGPVAVKDSVTKEQVRQIRQYFDLLGNFRFRCPQDTPLVVLKPEPVDDPAEIAAAGAPIDANAAGITLPPGVAAATVAPIAVSPSRKPVVPKKAAAPAEPAPIAPPVKKPPQLPKVAAPAAPVPPAAAASSPPPAPPKPKPKPKTDDAFRPSASKSDVKAPDVKAP